MHLANLIVYLNTWPCEIGCLVVVYIALLCGCVYDSLSDVGEIRVYQRADFQSGSRVLKKVF